MPNRNVSFLFTDVQGSTRLWESDEESMSRALVAHDQVLHRVVEGSGGRVFKHLGDGVGAVFPNVRDAMAAALESQRIFLDEDGPAPGLSIRIAVHSGVAEERDDDYFGIELSQVARLLEVAHGGQTLMTGAAVEEVANDLPDLARVEELGTFRLRDLSRPVTVFQLQHPDLPAEFPPLRTLEAFAHNLPIETTSFVGRAEEIEAVLELLGESRVVTLTGVGGSGKTRLAIQVGASALTSYPDGVWLVELGPLGDQGMIDTEVAARLKVRDVPGVATRDTIASFLRERRLLLVLDNCEHMVDAVAGLVQDLAGRCPDLVVLATSREALRVPGESAFHVPPLRIPDESGHVTAESVGRVESVSLFIERARQRRPGFELTDQNAPAVSRLCTRLDGLPLALELAAAQMRMFSIEQIIDRLDDRFRLLTGGDRTSLPRHRTLQATMEWSYDLLNPSEQKLLQLLSVFAGGFPVEGAEAVGASDEDTVGDVLASLGHLLDASLLEIDELASGLVRYRMLETVRQFALDKLLDAGDVTAPRQAHAAFYREWAGKVEEGLRSQGDSALVEQLEAERDNFRIALGWSLTEGDVETSLAMAAGLGRFWASHHYIREGVEWNERILAQDGPDSEERADAMTWAAHLNFHHGRLDRAQALADEAKAMADRFGDMRLRARAAGQTAAPQSMRNLAEATRRYRIAADLAREAGDTHYYGSCLVNLAWSHTWKGDQDQVGHLLAELPDEPFWKPFAHHVRGFALVYAGDEREAAEPLRDALVGFESSGNALFVRYTQVVQARALVNLEQPGESVEMAEEALRAGRETGAQVVMAWALHDLGRASLALGDPDGARRHLDEALMISSGGQLDLVSAEVLDYLAQLALVEGRPEDAVALAARGDRVRRSVGVVRPVREERLHQRAVTELRHALGDEAYDRLWAAAGDDVEMSV